MTVYEGWGLQVIAIPFAGTYSQHVRTTSTIKHAQFKANGHI